MAELVGVVQELSLARDLAGVMAIVRRAARDLTGADGATFVLKDGDECYYAEENAISPLWKGSRFPLETCVSGWVMMNRQSTVIENIFQDPRVPVDAYRPTFVRSMAMVPIRTRDPLGAIGNYWAKVYRPPAEQIAILQALADTTAVAMEHVQLFAELEQRVDHRTAELAEANRQLHHEVQERKKAEEEVRRLSLTDDLTGLHNRRGFMTFGEHDFRVAARSRQPVMMLFADLDGLKRVNDTFGHQAGDRLIRGGARALRASFRATDTVARLGGDEFAVLVTNYEGGIEQLRSRLQANIERISREENIDLAMSIGIVACTWDGVHSFEGLLQRADEVMYLEKNKKKL
ncbi:diguanylate cyclase [Methylovirgula sp. 4M-Z18]|nr:diguanylate cyclase [Methylovirgula sp. 4M-Z18]